MQTTTETDTQDMLDLLEECRAALPDAWLAAKCNVPRELIHKIDAMLLRHRPEPSSTTSKTDDAFVRNLEAIGAEINAGGPVHVLFDDILRNFERAAR